VGSRKIPRPNNADLVGLFIPRDVAVNRIACHRPVSPDLNVCERLQGREAVAAGERCSLIPIGDHRQTRFTQCEAHIGGMSSALLPRGLAADRFRLKLTVDRHPWKR